MRLTPDWEIYAVTSSGISYFSPNEEVEYDLDGRVLRRFGCDAPYRFDNTLKWLGANIGYGSLFITRWPVSLTVEGIEK